MYQTIDDLVLGVIGLGYVGLPLAVEFSKHRDVRAFDIDELRVQELRSGVDRTMEVTSSELKDARDLKFFNDIQDLKHCNCYIVTVPTPINERNDPDLSALFTASEMVGGLLNDGDLVIFESTVYPGLTEDECGKVIAVNSGLVYAPNKKSRDKKGVFHLGYSPERINPGDKQHRLTDIVKITSGSSPDIADIVDALYSSIIKRGTYKAPSIKVAEAAKVIENTQRDVNIALINELAVIFDKMGIDTEAVLLAAETKWNFLPFRPGLVGGHCIGVDPYYLTFKASEIGYAPKMILAGRKINDEMSDFVVGKILRLMHGKEIKPAGCKVLVLGVTFKEDCPDTRNSKVINVIGDLIEAGCDVDCWDPWVKIDNSDKLEAALIANPKAGIYDVIVLAVGHKEFVDLGAHKIRLFGKKEHLFFDLKYVFHSSQSDGRL